MRYNTWVKSFQKPVKNIKSKILGQIGHLSKKLRFFLIFKFIFWNIWPKCYTLLESVTFSEFLRA